MATRTTVWSLQRWLRPVLLSTAFFLWPREQWSIVGLVSVLKKMGKKANGAM